LELRETYTKKETDTHTNTYKYRNVSQEQISCHHMVQVNYALLSIILTVPLKKIKNMTTRVTQKYIAIKMMKKKNQ
jgi:GH15 family glucan-1,4-alpha-glucosidase